MFFDYQRNQEGSITDFSYTSAEETPNRKPRLLVIDDEESVCNFLSDFLSKEYECLTATSADEAFKILEEEKFAIILSDINLPDKNGIELARKIKEETPDTVVVMISGKADLESAINAIRAGAFDYIQKPFDLDNLEVSIKRALEHHLSLVGKRKYEEHLKRLIEQRTEEADHFLWYDTLTDLPNRFLFEDRLTQAIEQARYNKTIIATVLISINQLKRVYSILGTKYGDAVLREFVSRVKKCLSPGETLARFDDEFAILMVTIDREQQVIELIEEIKSALRKPIKLYDEEILLTISAGISIFPNDCRNAQEALKNASIALEKAKEEGGDNWLFFTSDLTEKSLNRLKMEMDLRRAIESDEFELHFQPKVDISTGKIIGAEALIRWNKPKVGMISPADFIPLAEETSLIIPLGNWVLRKAFTQCRLWMDKKKGFTVGVNLSAHQLREKNFVEKVNQLINETGVDPNLLEFEVTETILLKDPKESATILSKLRELGIKILIDDFGTGYSSLSYLKSLPLDGLKIDKSFIQGISAKDQGGAEFIVAIVTLAHTLRLKVVAEGVEREEELNLLRLVRCDEAQGFLFGKPMLPEMFANFWS